MTKLRKYVEVHICLPLFFMEEKKHILVAPINWGLGHATRCIPIIKALLQQNFIPILASDGAALTLLKYEFPELTCLELPAYNITYAKNGKNFKYKLLKDSPKILKNIKAEKLATDKIIAEYQIKGLISDNRFGVYSRDIPSVFITHQLRVLSGSTTWFSTKMHSHIINKFTQCWVPDVAESTNLSGKLGHTKKPNSKVKYIGPLSRFVKKKLPVKHDVLVILSGPEPQRQYLETKLLHEFATFNGHVVLVKGIVESEILKNVVGNITIYNYLTSSLLEDAINQSQLIVSRSGYTTIMDLAKLEKKAFFIPTPGQFEQHYLAERLQETNLAPYCKQDEFTIDKLKSVSNYKGLSAYNYKIDYTNLFSLFHTE